MASGELYGGGDCKRYSCGSGGFLSPVAFDNAAVANTGEHGGSGSAITGLFVCGADAPESGDRHAFAGHSTTASVDAKRESSKSQRTLSVGSAADTDVTSVS